MGYLHRSFPLKVQGSIGRGSMESLRARDDGEFQGICIFLTIEQSIYELTETLATHIKTA